MKRTRHEGPTVQRPGRQWSRWLALLEGRFDDAGPGHEEPGYRQVREPRLPVESNTVRNPRRMEHSLAGALGAAASSVFSMLKAVVILVLLVAGLWLVFTADNHVPRLKQAIATQMEQRGTEQRKVASADPNPEVQVHDRLQAWMEYARLNCRRQQGEVPDEIWEAAATDPLDGVRITDRRAPYAVLPAMQPYDAQLRGSYVCTNGQTYSWRSAVRTRTLPETPPMPRVPVQDEAGPVAENVPAN